MRLKISAGNWKMHLTLKESLEYIQHFNEATLPHDVQVILCAPFPFLQTLVSQNRHPNVFIGAQNCHQASQGAFTGEVSVRMLKSLGIKHIIIGHSERRQYFHEDYKILKDKVDQVLGEGLIPIFCVGEPLGVREKNNHFALIAEQLSMSLYHLAETDLMKVILAYEPVWAIGTGVTATPDQAQEMHLFIRNHLEKAFGVALAQGMPILYGGSVKAENARELFSQKDVDGGLVGGASLKVPEFLQITHSF